MTTTVIIILGAVLIGGIVLVLIGMRAPSAEDSLEDRLAELGAMDRPPTLEEIELSMPFSERILAPLLRNLAGFIGRMTPAQTIERTRQKLEIGGLAHRIEPTIFVAVRYVLAAGIGVALVVSLLPARGIPIWQKFLLIPSGTLLGAFLPVLWLGSKIRTRQDEIRKALPDALDLLTICVEAGLGFDQAMFKVVEKWDNELSNSFAKVLQEIQLGKVRREALRAMADNVDVSDVSTFIAAIIQADQLGVSIAKVLRIQSNEMRVRRRLRAEEEARKAPVKLMLPIAFLIFPSLFIVLLGPAAITLKNSALSGMLF
ncbi:MAG: type II secretion system F family protein [Anaerolineae bacterium]|nr:type II secretion system F family protein [Anaerolineae bacterium]